ncbi:MAG: ABC transporter ATP-binding protein [Deltaproteobacteria bacterium]|nr:ABC transporter ATP-binding protein [Deltaproteobacteria bacterium]
MEPLILAKELVKKFGPMTAVDHISFAVDKGECLGFLGPNGAVKTTTMRMLFGFSKATSGTLTVFGLSVDDKIREIKRRTGVVPQEDSLDPELTVLQNLLIYARYFDLPIHEARKRADNLLEFFQLKEKAKGEPGRLSGGMKRRLLIARALINQPELLILDEPTTGLDPQSRHMMWDRIKELQKQGVTSILTTHYMEEAERLCDRTVVMDIGKIIEEGRPADLVQKHGVKNLEEVFLKLTGRTLRE